MGIDVFTCHTLAKFHQGLHDILRIVFHPLNSPANSIGKGSLHYSLSSRSCTALLHSEIAAEPKNISVISDQYCKFF